MPKPVADVNKPAEVEGVKEPSPSDLTALRDDHANLGGRRRSRRHRRHGRKTLRPVPKGVHVKAKTLKRLLKAKGLKTSGKKSTLRARAREAHLIRGGRYVAPPLFFCGKSNCTDSKQRLSSGC